jgi:hypothetical protein
MIETMVTQGAAGSDCVGSSPAEAYQLAHAYSDAWEADISPQGAHAGDLLDMGQASNYTPGDDQGRPGPRD